MSDHKSETDVADETIRARREALARLGKYGAITGAVMLALMTGTKAPATSEFT